MCKIEKIVFFFFCKIDDKFASTDMDALIESLCFSFIKKKKKSELHPKYMYTQ